MSQHKPHVNKRKKKEVERLKKFFQEYPVVAIADLHNLPAANLQKIKKKLRGKAEFVIIKRRRAVIAINELKDKLTNADELLGKVKGMIALLFSKEDPFQLYKTVQKNIAPAAARAGQESPEDITIPAGPTAFTAGPMIGELGQLGLKTEVKDGKIAIREDKVIVKQGQIITAKVAELLTKFGIEPMKIGLNVVCTYQKGEILGKEVLGVSEEEYIGFIQTAHQEALNLAVFVAYPSKETIDLLVQKAAREGKSVADTIKFDEVKPAEERAEEKAEEPAPAVEAQKEEPKPEPPKQEHVKKEVHAQKPEVKHMTEEQQQEQPAPDPVQEEEHHTPQPAPQEKKSDEQVAQEVLKRLQEEKMQSQSHPTAKANSAMEQQEKDLSKIINKIKDQQSKGHK
ncbi:MAG TPA: 50S ribosomal protein L10 [Candidatus Nanoarchaeia archaeon]|nr:50S ribosomal protein L10 [Candidatus Nanoarchaeia archaeon]